MSAPVRGQRVNNTQLAVNPSVWPLTPTTRSLVVQIWRRNTTTSAVTLFGTYTVHGSGSSSYGTSNLPNPLDVGAGYVYDHTIVLDDIGNPLYQDFGATGQHLVQLVALWNQAEPIVGAYPGGYEGGYGP